MKARRQAETIKNVFCPVSSVVLRMPRLECIKYLSLLR